MKIGFLGCGNMGAAIAKGLTASGTSPDRIIISEIDQNTIKNLKDIGIVNVSPQILSTSADIIVLAVKPQSLKNALATLRLNGTAQPLLISIVAGVQLKTLTHRLTGYDRIIRAMPNIASTVKRGVTGIFANSNVTVSDCDLAQRILQTVGECVWVREEKLLDVVTAISGSGPAYVFYFMEIIEQVALELGLDDQTARTIVLQTFLGSSVLALNETDSLSKLRGKVTSKSGTTERAIESLKGDNTKNALRNAITAAKERAEEIGDYHDQELRQKSDE